MAIIEGPVSFDFGIEVSIECMGRTFHSNIGGVEVEIEFPRFYSEPPSGPYDSHFDHARIDSPEWLYEPYGWSDEAEMEERPSDNLWGYVLPSTGVRDDGSIEWAARVKRARFSFESFGGYEELSDRAQEVIHARRAWWERVKTWVETISFQDLGLAYIDTRQQRSRARIAWTEIDGTSVSLDLGGYMKFSMRPSRRIFSYTGMSRVFEMASSSAEPEEAWKFLRYAYHMQSSRQNRRAVMDAAVALEMASNDWASRHAPSLSSRGGKNAKKSPPLRTRVKKMREMGGTLADLEDVIDIRNRVAHEGYDPREDDISMILERTHQALCDVYPSHFALIQEMTMKAPGVPNEVIYANHVQQTGRDGSGDGLSG